MLIDEFYKERICSFTRPKGPGGSKAQYGVE
jgi:hypothetical protein